MSEESPSGEPIQAAAGGPPPPPPGSLAERLRHAAHERAPSRPAGQPPAAPSADGPRPDDDEAPDAGRGEGGRRLWGHLAELPMLVLFALVIAVVIKTFIAQAFFIPSGSMIPTLQVGDRVLVEKIAYRLGEPRRGHVVVFAKDVFGAEELDLPWWDDTRIFVRELLGLPSGREEDYIKRIVAVSGDVLRYAGKPRRLEVNGDVIEEPYVRGGVDRASPTVTRRTCARLDMEPMNNGCLVPAGRVFVMGDNRSQSEDSRFLGPVSEDKIVGRAFAIIWPPGDFGGL